MPLSDEVEKVAKQLLGRANGSPPKKRARGLKRPDPTQTTGTRATQQVAPLRLREAVYLWVAIPTYAKQGDWFQFQFKDKTYRVRVPSSHQLYPYGHNKFGFKVMLPPITVAPSAVGGQEEKSSETTAANDSTEESEPVEQTENSDTAANGVQRIVDSTDKKWQAEVACHGRQHNRWSIVFREMETKNEFRFGMFRGDATFINGIRAKALKALSSTQEPAARPSNVDSATETPSQSSPRFVLRLPVAALFMMKCPVE